MITDIFAVLDACAQRYLEPFFCPNVDVAIREFRRLANDTTCRFAIHPEDYVLYHIGTWDFETGKLVPLNEPHRLAIAIQLIAQDPSLEQEQNRA